MALLRRHFAVLTILITLLLVFLLGALAPRARVAAFYDYGAIPARVLDGIQALLNGQFDAEMVSKLGTLFSAIFLHGDAAHLLHNALFLWIFGAMLEPLVGSLSLLLLFLFAGAGGNLAQAFFHTSSLAPTIGASGAVAGLEGAYLAMAVSRTLPWPHVWPISRPVPPHTIVVLCLINFYLDVFSVLTVSDHVAYAAHIGGFVCGAVFSVLLLRPRPSATAGLS